MSCVSKIYWIISQFHGFIIYFVCIYSYDHLFQNIFYYYSFYSVTVTVLQLYFDKIRFNRFSPHKQTQDDKILYNLGFCCKNVPLSSACNRTHFP